MYAHYCSFFYCYVLDWRLHLKGEALVVLTVLVVASTWLAVVWPEAALAVNAAWIRNGSHICVCPAGRPPAVNLPPLTLSLVAPTLWRQIVTFYCKIWMGEFYFIFFANLEGLLWCSCLYNCICVVVFIPNVVYVLFCVLLYFRIWGLPLFHKLWQHHSSLVLSGWVLNLLRHWTRQGLSSRVWSSVWRPVQWLIAGSRPRGIAMMDHLPQRRVANYQSNGRVLRVSTPIITGRFWAERQ